MSKSPDTPKPRTPSGAAVAGAFPRPKKYPCQLVTMVSQELYDHISEAATVNGMSKSEASRLLIEAGIDSVNSADRA